MSKNKIRTMLRRLIPLNDYEIDYFLHIFNKRDMSEHWERKNI